MRPNYANIDAEGNVQNIFYSTIKPMGPIPIKDAPFEAQRMAKLYDLKIYIDQKTSEYKSKYPNIEVESFKEKASEAVKVVKVDYDLPLTETPTLSELTGWTTIASRNALADSVYEKFSESLATEATGVQLRDAIKAATTQAELDSINW